MALAAGTERGDHRHPVNVRHLGPGRTAGERIADGVAARVGSWPFIIVQSTLLVLWIVGNAFLIRDWLNGKPFDPYPFILLNLMLFVPSRLYGSLRDDESEPPSRSRS